MKYVSFTKWSRIWLLPMILKQTRRKTRKEVRFARFVKQNNLQTFSYNVQLMKSNEILKKIFIEISVLSAITSSAEAHCCSSG